MTPSWFAIDHRFGPRKTQVILQGLGVMEYIDRIASRVGVEPPWWGIMIRPMTGSEIRTGRKRCKGHGFWEVKTKTLALNKSMPARAIRLNLYHEMFHVALPMLSDEEINGAYLPELLAMMGDRMRKSDWKYMGTRRP